MKARVLGVEVTNESWLRAIAEQRGTNVAHAAAHASDKQWADLNAVAKWAKEMSEGPGLFIPRYLRNPLNNRRHWRPVAKEEKDAREAVHDACAVGGVERRLPVRVTMTRYGPRKMDAGCGLNAALKPVRDGVADYFEHSDGDEAVYDWQYRQKPSPRACYGVRIEFEYPGRL